MANLRRLTSSSWFGRPASIDYSYQVDKDRLATTRYRADSRAVSWAPRVARDHLGLDFFHNVVGVYVWDVPLGKELELVTELARLPRLRHLVIPFIALNDDKMQRLAGLRHLTTLEVGGPALGDEALQSMGELWRLQALSVSGSFSDDGLAHLRRLRQLRHLDVSSPLVADQGLIYLAELPALESLSLSSIRPTERGYRRLAKCSRLSRLVTSATDDDLRGIGRITSLTELYLRRSPVSDKGVQYLTGLTALERLDLSRTRVTDEAMTSIQGFRSKGAKPQRHRDIGRRLAPPGDAAGTRNAAFKRRFRDSDWLRAAQVAAQIAYLVRWRTSRRPNLQTLRIRPSIATAEGDHPTAIDAASTSVVRV